jgi:YHYH protein
MFTSQEPPCGVGASVRRWTVALPLLAVAAAPAFAHDITNVLLSARMPDCAEYVAHHTARVMDVQNRTPYEGRVSITVIGDSCTIQSNAVPNHDFNATGRFRNSFREQSQRYVVPARPRAEARPTSLSLQYDNGIFLNGVKLDLLAAGCHGVANGMIGCNDMHTPYRYDPMAPKAGFGTDEHNAHTQPDGTYHYHGNPMALFEQARPTQPSPVVGFAADGFPIFGSYIRVDGKLRKARSSYRLKTGLRSGGPGGAHDGTFVDDWQYLPGAGDLDECNGMTQDGIYGYVITETYPHVMACFKGTPHESFRKRRP